MMMDGKLHRKVEEEGRKETEVKKMFLQSHSSSRPEICIQWPGTFC